MNNNRLYGIDIVRIFCCIGVYTQHYLGMELENSKAAVTAFRRTIWFKSIFGIFWGELILISFFVISGFFITYNRDGETAVLPTVKKCVYRCFNIIFPTLVVIAVTSFVTLVMKLLNMSDMFSIRETGRDIFKLLIGIPGDIHIYYAYPLWFQHFIMMCYIFGYVFVILVGNNKRVKPATYILVLLYTLFNSEYTYMVFAGMAAGELCSGECRIKIHKVLGNSKLCYALILTIMAVMAYVYDRDYNRPVIYGPASAFIAILLILIYNLDLNRIERKDGAGTAKTVKGRHRIISFLSENTYSCYLIHFFIFCSLMRAVYMISLKLPFFWISNAVGCFVMYLIMTVLVWIGGYFFTRYVLSPLKKIYDIIWEGMIGGFVND